MIYALERTGAKILRDSLSKMYVRYKRIKIQKIDPSCSMKANLIIVGFIGEEAVRLELLEIAKTNNINLSFED